MSQQSYLHSWRALQRGQMPKAWDLYESRWSVGIPKPGFLRPETEWKGELFRGRTLLLYYEQGDGDMFQFIRYASMAKARGGQVLLACTQEQADVLETCPGLDQVVPVVHGRPGIIPSFDLHLPVLSLPRIFRTDLSTIPCGIPYLSFPAHVPNRHSLTSLLAREQGPRRIGLVWAGAPSNPNDRNRSFPPAVFDRLANVQGCDWFSFQLGAKIMPDLPGITSLAPLLTTWADTAYALQFMDRIITVDTALAHLAGALGLPVTLLLQHDPDWRWLLGRVGSPWYPSVRIFRQPRPGDWESVIEEVVQTFAIEFQQGCESVV